MSSPRTRRATAGALLALAALPGFQQPQDTTAESPALPVLYYSVGELSKDFEGDASEVMREYKERIEAVEERITVSVFNELLGAENARYHWFEAVSDVFSLRLIVQAWNDSRVRETFDSMDGLWATGSYSETVLVPSPADPVQPPPFQRLILVHRTARAKTAEYVAARAAAVELTDYVNGERDDVWVHLYENFLGDFGTFHWLVRTKDLATWHQVETALHADPEYQQLFESTFSHCIDGSLHTTWGISMLGP